MKKLALFLLGIGCLTAVSLNATTSPSSDPTYLEEQTPCNPAPCNPAPCQPDTVCTPAPCNPAPCNPAPCNPAPCNPAPCNTGC